MSGQSAKCQKCGLPVINVEVRVYGELNDFLPHSRRQESFHRCVPHPTSVKDLLEGAGIPHTEISVVMINGVPRSPGYLIERACRVAAYPVFSVLEPTGLPEWQPAPLDEPRFVLDVHLGRLARYLRLLGFDTAYDNAADDDSLVDSSRQSERVLLTQDRELLMRKSLLRGYLVRADDPRRQLVEVVRRFALAGQVQPFTRCMSCNGLLHPVEKAAIEHRLEPKTRRFFEEFWRCEHCGNLYWQGSHFERLRKLVDSLTDA